MSREDVQGLIDRAIREHELRVALWSGCPCARVGRTNPRAMVAPDRLSVAPVPAWGGHLANTGVLPFEGAGSVQSG
jgi:hypothetical protein